MEPTDVLLIGLPTMLREIVKEIFAGKPDIRVTGELDGSEALLETVQACRPDVLIVANGAELPEPCARVLPRLPSLKVVTIGDDGRMSFFFELRRVPLGEVSPDSLTAAVRRARAAET